MADDVQYTVIRTGVAGVRGYQWVLEANSTGKPVQLAKQPDISVSTQGTGAYGAAATFEWSNDERADPADADHANAVWHTCNLARDGASTFSKTATGGDQILEIGLWYRPKTAGVATNITFRALGG